jgi:hypothetical protein
MLKSIAGHVGTNLEWYYSRADLCGFDTLRKLEEEQENNCS